MMIESTDKKAEHNSNNLSALKNITDSQVNAVARSFWRRIYPYRNNYERELPDKLPVEFFAHMATALTWVDDERTEPAKASQQVQSENVGHDVKITVESLVESARCMGALANDKDAHTYWLDKTEEYRKKVYEIIETANAMPTPKQERPLSGGWGYGEDNDGWYVESNGEQICYCASEENARHIAEVMGAAPKQEPICYLIDDGYSKTTTKDAASLKIAKRFNWAVTPLYAAPPQAAAIPEFDKDLVIAVLEDYADMQTSGFIPTANRYAVSDVIEQVEILSATETQERKFVDLRQVVSDGGNS